MIRLVTFIVIFVLIVIPGVCQSELINISGIVTASPCVFNTSKSDTTIVFDNTYKGQLSEPKSFGNERKIRLVIDNCPASTNYVTVDFSGPIDSTTTYAYANKGKAKNVAIQLKFANEQWENSSAYPGGHFQMPVDKSSNTATFDMLTRIYSKTGLATSGDIFTSVNISFTYQ